ncbi:tetratricopeptide (TPR) repeat protein [Catenuloplanes nepalensis]|uniref:Tetratricopeptide (TPR) repeat protein n=1 Tax=Catenuloplanes nepalensis TaxID=587533 RepID=A0ABT9MX29_9ACTN|nr:cyclophane-containing RiPP biosynthesis TPR protein HaaT [Catenuloplanes nepalensis]MDP9796001.1 tetratricopeptide (TPR) repeat protein [Catenuloplanes nepalensis]
MKLRRVTVVALIAAGVATVTLMIGLVTNAASAQQRWPGPLALVQQHPWQSFALLAIAAVALAALSQALSESGHESQGNVTGPEDPSRRFVEGAAVLRTLPHDVTGFTNRHDELQQVVVDAKNGGAATVIRTIDGMPGVGKTAFAIHAGHLLAPKFPDGQLFLNLNGHTPGREPVRPADALTSLLLADGVTPQQIPNSDDIWAATEARAALWRSRIADRRLLLILDNAATFAQIEHLLPGTGGCLVLITSRRRLIAPDAAGLQMDALSAADAEALFVRLAGRGHLDPAAVADLVTAAGRLPLAVSLLAARLRHHPAWSAADLRDRLTAAQHRLTELRAGERAVAAAFDLSYQDLPPERQRFFRTLSLFPGLDVGEDAAAALCGVSPQSARAELDALYSDHLLDETAPGRYRFHDLVKEYGHSLGEGDGQEEIMSVERLAQHYLHTIEAANTHIRRGAVPVTTRFADSRAATAWLEDERANVLACVHDCVGRGMHSLVVKLAAAMAPYLRHSGPFDQAAELHRTAAASASRSGSPAAEAEALADLGLTLRLMADYRAATESLRAALARYRDLGDAAGQAGVLNQIGIVDYLTADYAAAAQAQFEALRLCRGTGDLLGQANALADLGMVRRMTGDLPESAVAQEEALRLYRRIGDRYGEANALRDLGIVRSLTGDYAVAEQYAREALAAYSEIGDTVHQAYALNELGVVRRLRGDHEGAVAAHEDALHRYAEAGDRFGEANALRHLGVIHRLRGRPAAAADAQERAVSLYRELGSRGGLAAATTELGLLNDDTAALDRASELYLELGDRCGQLEVLNHLGARHLASGEPHRAENQHEVALSLARELGVPLEEARALHGLAQCHHALGRPQQANRALHAARAIYERLGVPAL